MTAQVSEVLLYEGEELSLCNEPLELYIEKIPMKVRFTAPHTALWRGYVGTWAIEADRLYLKSLEATIEGEKGHEEVGMGVVGMMCGFQGATKNPQLARKCGFHVQST